MSKGLLINHDAAVSAWAFKTFNRIPVLVDRALGVIEHGQLVGALLFTSYNGYNAELSYYGKDSLSRGIVRNVARIALTELNLARCTITVPKRPAFLVRKVGKFHFRFEGIQRRFYGPTDAPKHTGCRFVLFREDMEKLASMKLGKAA